MGLGAPKKRTKISHDPNNTAWARSTTNFGHKILASQGWQPGQFLGAENANHSEHYTAANASHIRVLLREDNLGLGAQRGTSNAETFGLSTLSGIFGRLNGKSEVEVQKVQDVQRDLGLRTYQAQKFGFMNFVSGGLLVGDKMEEPKQENINTEKKVPATSSASTGSEASKKRKAEDQDRADGSAVAVATASKKRKADKKEDREKASMERKRSEKAKRKRDSEVDVSGSDSETEATTKRKKQVRSDKEADSDDKARLKAEKRARKEERRRRKEEKRRRKESKSAAPSKDQSAESSEDDDESQQPAAEVTVAPAPAPAPAFGGSRHAVRQRYIQQKRMASMNPQALQEILMLKAAG